MSQRQASGPVKRLVALVTSVLKHGVISWKVLAAARRCLFADRRRVFVAERGTRSRSSASMMECTFVRIRVGRINSPDGTRAGSLVLSVS